MKNERILEIKRLLLSNQQVTNTELCETFGVSIETIRRDLNQLEKEGFLYKVYGGARLTGISSGKVSVQTWQERIVANEDSKQSIAVKAASLIPDNCTVFLDSGTSIFEMLPYLKRKKNLTVLTNALRNACELGMNKDITVYCIGGIIKTDVLVSTGFLASEFLAYFNHIDYAVIACDGFVPAQGCGDSYIELAMFKKKVLEKSARKIVVADHTKFGISGSCLCCPTEEIDIVVTDALTDREMISSLQTRGVEVMVADLAEGSVPAGEATAAPGEDGAV